MFVFTIAFVLLRYSSKNTMHFKLTLTLLLNYVVIIAANQGNVRSDQRSGEAKPDLEELSEMDFMDGDEQTDGAESEESGKRLSSLFVKIDSDKNDKMSQTELKDWVVSAESSFINENAENIFGEYDLNQNGAISWEEYEAAVQKLGPLQREGKEANQNSMEYDKRKFSASDANSDGNCDKEEFSAFLYPEMHDQTRSFIVKETLAEVDSNNNGYVELNEFSSSTFAKDMQNQDSNAKQDEYFAEYLDTDHDGKLNSDEILLWVAPTPSEQAMDEAKYLVSEADEDQDGFVSENEMMKSSEIFLNSRVAEFDKSSQLGESSQFDELSQFDNESPQGRHEL